MKWIYIFFAMLIVAGGIFTVRSRQKISTPAPTASPSKTAAVSSATPPTTSPQSAVYFPMTKYTDRLTNRTYGQAITAADSKNLPCGAPFTGIHTGDDLEVTQTEFAEDVPVYAIADGTVRQTNTVSGYGGLIVIEHLLNGETVTAYYGHVSLSRATVKKGDKVVAGQKITVLGHACSIETGGERKHLHFAIHRGSTIDVHGYVTQQSQLSAWLNPKQELLKAKAASPTN